MKGKEGIETLTIHTYTHHMLYICYIASSSPWANILTEGKHVKPLNGESVHHNRQEQKLTFSVKGQIVKI